MPGPSFVLEITRNKAPGLCSTNGIRLQSTSNSPEKKNPFNNIQTGLHMRNSICCTNVPCCQHCHVPKLQTWLKVWRKVCNPVHGRRAEKEDLPPVQCHNAATHCLVACFDSSHLFLEDSFQTKKMKTCHVFIFLC